MRKIEIWKICIQQETQNKRGICDNTEDVIKRRKYGIKGECVIKGEYVIKENMQFGGNVVKGNSYVHKGNMWLMEIWNKKKRGNIQKMEICG